MSRVTPGMARDLLAAYDISRSADFHTLSSEQVDALLASADAFKYRKPRNANGSRGRYFHAYLCRIIARETTTLRKPK
jgi:hypothetical protein